MNRETFTRLVRKELSGLRRILMAACSGNGDEADDIAPLAGNTSSASRTTRKNSFPAVTRSPTRTGG
jgi:hypothetical protein